MPEPGLKHFPNARQNRSHRAARRPDQVDVLRIPHRHGEMQLKNVASNTLYGVEFRLITPAGVPFASHATDQLDYLAGEVRVVTSPGASLPATITGFST
ncbi:MAG: hypothetical protein WA746_02415 [Isosphaeraceae bacterium]